MNTTTHPFAPEEIMAFVDGELSADSSKSISAHVETCSECQEIVTRLSWASHALSSWTAGTVPAPLQDQVLDQSRAGPKLSAEGVISKLRRFSHSSPAFTLTAAAFVFVLILIGMSAGRYEKRASIPRPAADAITEQPAAEGRGSLGKVVTQGLAVDSKGVIAALKEHGKNFASIDGQPLSDKQGGIFTGPMIARTVSLSVVVKDFDAARASLDAILARHNGYAAGLNVATPQGAARTLQASLRIPAPQLVAAVAELKALGRVEAETQNGEEVTQQHGDLVARLKNSRETEQRLQDVLRTRTGKVKDVLEVEEEISRVRGEIEQMEAEQQTLEHRVSFATIDLKLAEEYKAQLNLPAPSVATQLRNATINGFRNASESVLGIVLFFAESGPTLLLWLVILFVPARLLWRRYRRAQALGS